MTRAIKPDGYTQPDRPDQNQNYQLVGPGKRESERVAAENLGKSDAHHDHQHDSKRLLQYNNESGFNFLHADRPPELRIPGKI